MKRMALGMVCASALACATQARSDEPAQEPGKLFQSLDKNGDGTLGPDEVGEDRRRFFERLVRVGDKNEDQKLSRDEFVAAMSEEEKPVETPRPRGGGDRPMFSPGQMFDRLDRNDDGKFTKEEIPDQAPAEIRERLELVFTAAGKSEITREDFEKTMAKYGPPGRDGRRPGDDARPRGEGGDRPRPEAGGDRPRPEGRDMAREGDRRPGPDREGSGRPDGERGERMEGRGFGRFGEGRPASPLVRVLDRDENGKLNRREIARLVERFEELDRNEDGELDHAELMGPMFGGGFPPFGGRPGFGGPDGMRRDGADRGREMAREGDRPREGARDGDRPRPEGPRDGDRHPEGPRDGDRPRPEGARDGDRPRPEGAREGDRPRPEGRPGDRPEGRPEGGPPRGERGPGRDGGRPGDLFARLDKDGDGSISKEEAPERMKDRFKDLDGNGDGKITGEEFRDAIAKEFGVPGERRERRPELDQ